MINKPMPHVFFYVQHLLGIGHVQRASAIVRACIDHGLQVTVASGGEPLPESVFSGASLLQLPSVKSADANFSGLIDSTGQLISEQFKQERKTKLLSAFTESRADIALIESYPFGRRQLRWELKPLLQLVASQHPKTLIASSIRDVLQQRSRQREIETHDLIDRYFDAVFVHGDQDFIPLSESFSLTEEVREKIIYTGLVNKPLEEAYTSGCQGKDEIIVSAGGGAVGFALMELALNARRSGYLADRVWRFLLGPNMSIEDQNRLQNNAPDGCYFDPARSDFADLLRNCHLSISQAGYNTVLDILHARCPSLLIPFAQDGESEQTLRARKLASLGRCGLLLEGELSVEKFIQQCRSVPDLDTSMPQGINCNGADNTAKLLYGHWLQKNEEG